MSVALDDYEKSLMQYLFAVRCVTKAVLDADCASFLPDFPECVAKHVSVPLADSLKKINLTLKKLGFEIKSVFMKEGDEGDKVQYFSVANLEADGVAVAMGGSMTESEVPAFKKVLEYLLENSYESDHMLTGASIRPKAWTAEQMGQYLERLRQEGWLKRDSANGYWIIGPRSHIELRSLLEQQLIDALDDAAGEDQEQHAALRGEALSKLPQIYYY